MVCFVTEIMDHILIYSLAKKYTLEVYFLVTELYFLARDFLAKTSWPESIKYTSIFGPPVLDIFECGIFLFEKNF